MRVNELLASRPSVDRARALYESLRHDGAKGTRTAAAETHRYKKYTAATSARYAAPLACIAMDGGGARQCHRGNIAMQTALKMSESPESAAVPQTARYARAINASKRVRWDSDVDVTTSTQSARAYKSNRR